MSPRVWHQCGSFLSVAIKAQARGKRQPIPPLSLQPAIAFGTAGEGVWGSLWPSSPLFALLGIRSPRAAGQWQSSCLLCGGLPLLSRAVTQRKQAAGTPQVGQHVA